MKFNGSYKLERVVEHKCLGLGIVSTAPISASVESIANVYAATLGLVIVKTGAAYNCASGTFHHFVGALEGQCARKKLFKFFPFVAVGIGVLLPNQRVGGEGE